MLSLSLTLLILLLAAASLTVITKRRMEECVPLCLTGAIAVLYIFYISGALFAGRLFLYAAVFALAAIAAKMIIADSDREKRRAAAGRIFTPALLLFLLMAVFFIIYAKDLKPSVWDELRLWAAYPKALHFSQSLQVGEGALLYPTMQSYPPGMALFIYFLSALSKTYSYGCAYAAYWIFAAALFLPALKNIRWKRWYLIAPVSFVLLCMPLLLTINSGGASGDWAYYYGSLFIEASLGCCLGHAVYMAVKDPFDSAFVLTDLSLVLFIMPLLKNAGAMYGIFVILAAVAAALIKKERSPKKNLLKALIPLAGMAAAYFSWQLIINTRGTGEFIDFNVSSFTAEKALNVLKGLTTWGIIPVIYIALFFVLADIVITNKKKDISRGTAFVAAMGIVLPALFFLYGYTSHYGVMLSSIHRYTEVFTFAAFYYLFMRLILTVKAGDKDQRTGIAARAVIGAAALVFMAAGVFLVVSQRGLQLKNNTYRDIGKIKRDIIESLEDEGYDEGHPAKVYLALGGDIRKESQRHETYALELIGSNANIRSIWCDKIYNEAVDGVVTDRNEAASCWAESLASGGYEYVLAVNPDDEINDAVSKLAPELKGAKEMALYRVLPSGGGYPVTLEDCKDPTR